MLRKFSLFGDRYFIDESPGRPLFFSDLYFFVSSEEKFINIYSNLYINIFLAILPFLEVFLEFFCKFIRGILEQLVYCHIFGISI